MTPLQLAGLAAVPVLLLSGGMARAVHAGGGYRKRVARRLAGLSAPRTVMAQMPSRSLSMAAPSAGFWPTLVLRVQALFGYDRNVPGKATNHWIAALVALALARGIVWLSSSLVGDLAWLDFPVTSFFMVRAYFVWCARRWRNELFKQFPDALATIVRAVRVGVSLPEGIRRVANEAPEPTASIFRRIADEMSIGTPLNEALSASTSVTGLPEYRFFATALILQARTGGGLAVTLDGLADVIRKRVAVKARGKALAGEARASAFILSALPVVTALIMLLVSPSYMTQLFTDGTGHAILAAACLTEGFGILVMRGMIIRALS